MKKLFEMLKNMEKNKLLNLFLLLALSIVILIVTSNTKDNDNELQTVLNSDSAEYNGLGYEESLEKRLKNVLSKVHGVGDVEVFITFSYGHELSVLLEEKKSTQQTSEKAADNGERTIVEEQYENKAVLVPKSSGTSEPLIIKEAKPKVSGALIVAEGGDLPYIKENLTGAVMALLDIESYKITILKMDK